ncbi:MAG: hypothetical protein NZ484_00280 [Patescibacteria group bacterium]|nr:hypothetical protein [Patescibacteria group bacterium]MCX7589617.1 hypothetical protein [Patescibacteria group bacterium]MDW8279616.1 hypothetical protein [bacterium]
MNEQNKESFLEKIRSLDYKTKNRLLFILSAIAFLIVLYIWGAYFNFMTMNLVNNNLEQKDNLELKDKIKIGGAFIGQIGENINNYLKNIFSSPKEYNISK